MSLILARVLIVLIRELILREELELSEELLINIIIKN